MDKKLLVLAIIFFLAFSINLSLIVFESPINRTIKATAEQSVSAKQSMVLAWPYLVLADGNASSIVSIFIKSDSGSPIANKQVILRTNFGNLKNSSATTDNTGKVEFSISSDIEGVAEIEALVDNNRLDTTVSIKFRN